jgi:hypothetical protein
MQNELVIETGKGSYPKVGPEGVTRLFAWPAQRQRPITGDHFRVLRRRFALP